MTAGKPGQNFSQREKPVNLAVSKRSASYNILQNLLPHDFACTQESTDSFKGNQGYAMNM